MTTPRPAIANTLLMGDDPYLLAELSSLVGRRGCYVPVLDGPRMSRPDADAEVTVRNNATARSKAKVIVFAGMADESVAAFRDHFPAKRTVRVASVADAVHAAAVRERPEKLRVPRRDIGPSLLRALRERRQLEFEDRDEEAVSQLARGRRHLVVCEKGDLHAQVVAANYAHAYDADLVLIPQVPEEEADSLLAELYGVYEQRSVSATEAMQNVIADLRALSAIDVGEATSITFFTDKLPWGFAYPEVPSSHVFAYPSVGMTVLNGIVAQDEPVKVVMGIDPSQVQAGEVAAVADALASRGAFVTVRRSTAARVREVSRAIELYPYDLLLISTHCGDAEGWRWTYEYVDREGRSRTLVVDVTISVAQVPKNEKLEVVQFKKFVSLDGVDWADREAKKRLPVGTALLDYLNQIQAQPPLEPVRRELVARVHGSAALRMYDGNYLAAMRTLANTGTPIVINNACASWHELSARFAFADCRLYIGTLFSVSNTEAQEVITRLMTKHAGKPIALALWNVQREIYGDTPRRPYAAMGVYFQSLRTATSIAPVLIAQQLQRALGHWKSRQHDATMTANNRLTVDDYVNYLEAELAQVTQRWLRPAKMARHG